MEKSATCILLPTAFTLRGTELHCYCNAYIVQVQVIIFESYYMFATTQTHTHCVTL